MKLVCVTMLVSFFCNEFASAAIIGRALGSAAPPTRLGQYDLEPFPALHVTLIRDVFSAAGPTGEVLFDQPLSRRRLGAGWGTWSHGYDGDVFYTNGRISATLILPPDTGAFIFYAEPNSGYTEFLATTDTGESLLSYPAYWRSDATGIAFYSTAGESISSIRVSTTYRDFAIGEFLIARVPEPGAGGWACLAAIFLRRKWVACAN